MPFRLNNTEITAMKFNNVDVDKAYLNGTQVFSRDPVIGELYGGGYYLGDNKVCTNKVYTDGAQKLITGTYDTCITTISGTINGYSDWYLPNMSELDFLYSLRYTFHALGIWDYDMNYWASDDFGDPTYAFVFHMGSGELSFVPRETSCLAVAFRSIV